MTLMANEAWVPSSTPAIKRAWGNYKRGVWGKNICSLSINDAARCFFFFQKVNLFILSVHRIRSAWVQGRVVMVRAVG